jgi:hypothetical protein
VRVVPPVAGPEAELARLARPTGPWIHLLDAAPADARQLGWLLGQDGIVVRLLRGHCGRSTYGLLDEIGAALQLPGDPAEDWAGLAALLTDMAWLPGAGHVLVVARASLLLAAERLDELRGLVDAVRDVARARAEEGEPIPFHLVLQDDTLGLAALRARLDAAGARYAELSGWDAEEPSAAVAVSARSSLSGGAPDAVDAAAGTAASTVDGVRSLGRAWESFRGSAGPVRVYVPVLAGPADLAAVVAALAATVASAGESCVVVPAPAEATLADPRQKAVAAAATEVWPDPPQPEPPQPEPPQPAPVPPAGTPTSRADGTPWDGPVETAAVRPVGTPSGDPVETAAVRPVEAPVARPAETPVARPVAAPEVSAATASPGPVVAPTPVEAPVGPPTTEIQAAEPAPTAEIRAAEPAPTAEIRAAEPTPTAEIRAAEPTPTAEIRAAEPAPTAEIPAQRPERAAPEGPHDAPGAPFELIAANLQWPFDTGTEEHDAVDTALLAHAGSSARTAALFRTWVQDPAGGWVRVVLAYVNRGSIADVESERTALVDTLQAAGGARCCVEVLAVSDVTEAHRWLEARCRPLWPVPPPKPERVTLAEDATFTPGPALDDAEHAATLRALVDWAGSRAGVVGLVTAYADGRLVVGVALDGQTDPDQVRDEAPSPVEPFAPSRGLDPLHLRLSRSSTRVWTRRAERAAPEPAAAIGGALDRPAPPAVTSMGPPPVRDTQDARGDTVLDGFRLVGIDRDTAVGKGDLEPDAADAALAEWAKARPGAIALLRGVTGEQLKVYCLAVEENVDPEGARRELAAAAAAAGLARAAVEAFAPAGTISAFHLDLAVGSTRLWPRA